MRKDNSYENKIFHMQVSHAIWFFPYKANTIFSRLSTCLNAGAVDRYDLKYKHLFIEAFQIKILKAVKHSFSSLSKLC